MEVVIVQILKMLGLVTFLFVLCSCAEREASHKETQLSLYPREAPVSFLQYLEKSLEARRFQLADSNRYRDFFGADRNWSRRGNVLPVRLSFLPSQTQRHMYVFEAYIADTKQDNGDNIFITLKGGIPQEDTVPTLEISTAVLSDSKNPPFLPDSAMLEKLQKSLFSQIDKNSMTWETLTTPPLNASAVMGPHAVWRKERFISATGTVALSRSDLTLVEIAARPNALVRFSFSVAPLMTNIGNETIMLTILSFDMDRTGKIVDTEVKDSSLTVPYMPFRLLSKEDCDEISEVVLRRLFKFPLAPDLRKQERVRFCYPVSGAGGKFYERLHKDAAIPERNPFVHDPQLPVPFNDEQKVYTSLNNGAFHYYAGYVLPVNESAAYVFGATINCAGISKNPDLAIHLTKGVFGWKIHDEWIRYEDTVKK